MSLIIFLAGSGDLFYRFNDNRNQVKMLYLVGLGLADEKDITVRGLEVVKSASRVYLEAYTSILLVETEKLVGYLGFHFMIYSNG